MVLLGQVPVATQYAECIVMLVFFVINIFHSKMACYVFFLIGVFISGKLHNKLLSLLCSTV